MSGLRRRAAHIPLKNGDDRHTTLATSVKGNSLAIGGGGGSKRQFRTH
jgi:hypothetical protein